MGTWPCLSLQNAIHSPVQIRPGRCRVRSDRMPRVHTAASWTSCIANRGSRHSVLFPVHPHNKSQVPKRKCSATNNQIPASQLSPSLPPLCAVANAAHGRFPASDPARRRFSFGTLKLRMRCHVANRTMKTLFVVKANVAVTAASTEPPRPRNSITRTQSPLSVR